MATAGSTRGEGGDGRGRSSATGADRAGGEDGADPWAPTGVVAALPEEAQPILERLGPPEGPRSPGAPGGGLRRTRDGRLGGVPVTVAVTGDGRRNAHRGIEALLEARRLARLLVVGVGGGLVPGLEPCTVVAGRTVWRRGEPPRRPSGPLLDRATGDVGLPPAVVATVDRLLDSPAAKKAVLDELSRDDPDPGLAVADLESAHYASAAEERGIPWLVLRAVSDGASEALPSFLNRCRDEGGSVRRSRVARHLLLHPGALPELLRLREVVGRCAERLADSVEELLRSLERVGGAGVG